MILLFCGNEQYHREISHRLRDEKIAFTGYDEYFIIKIKSSGDDVAICSEDDSKSLKALHRMGIPVISCGMCQKSTVTLSSLKKERVMIAVQRQICDSLGRTVPVQEISAARDGALYTLMAVTVIRLILGRTENS